MSATTAVALLLFGFVAWRAAIVPLTYDEAASYLRYASADVLSSFSFAVATNHLLQTVLTKFSHDIFGSSELALRLPSLAGYALYLVFSLLILRRVRSRGIAFAGFLLLNLNPYLLDYFGLSRGYGLSAGLLVASLYYLLQFLDAPNATGALSRLSRCLVLACAAVLANFSTLNAYVGILMVLMVAMAISARMARVGGDVGGRAVGPHGRWLWLPAALAMSLLVFSQDTDLSEDLYEAVRVTIVGVPEAEIDQVQVFRIDTRGRWFPLLRARNVWRSERRLHFTGLRVELQPAVADAAELIVATIGDRTFTYRRHAPGPWTVSEAVGIRTLESGPSLTLAHPRTPALRGIINWRGESSYWQGIAHHAAAVAAAVAVLAVVLALVGRAGEHVRIVTREQWRTFSTGVTWVAALSAAPLYVLRRNGELYYGGERGFVEDTLGSLVAGTLYGRSVTEAWTAWIIGAGVILGLLAWLALHRGAGRRWWEPAVPPMAILLLLLTASAAVIVQHQLFGTQYPLGRTALFYIPLTVLLAVFLFDSAAARGTVRKRIGIGLAAAAAGIAAVHFLTAANLTTVHDWPDDAATRRMIRDLTGDARQHGGPAEHVTLGVEAQYFPVAVYYARRTPDLAIDVDVAPTSPAMNYLYLRARHQEPWMRVLSVYPLTRSLLVKNQVR